MQKHSTFAWYLCCLWVIASTSSALAQLPTEQGAPRSAAIASQLPEYVLGPNDELIIAAIEADEIANKPVRVSVGGDLTLPMVGRIHAAGLTVQQLESVLIERLKVYIREPQVSVSVTQFRSQPATVIGAVRNPGVIQLEGRKNLLEVLSMAGGTLTEASSKVTITRQKESGPLPLPITNKDDGSAYRIAEVDMRAISDGSRPEQNIQILPHDVISVGRAPLVYVVGVVNKPGGFVLNDKENISVLQLVAMAGGTAPNANTKAARILRPVPGAERIELPINLKDIIAGKAKDTLLKPEDILYIPDSYAKGTLRKTLDTAIQVTTGMAIYRY